MVASKMAFRLPCSCQSSLFDLYVGQLVSLLEQHELEHGPSSVGFGFTAVGLLPAVQAFAFAAGGLPINEFVQLPSAGVFNQWLGMGYGLHGDAGHHIGSGRRSIPHREHARKTVT